MKSLIQKIKDAKNWHIFLISSILIGMYPASTELSPSPWVDVVFGLIALLGGALAIFKLWNINSPIDSNSDV